jgi:plastocyanin
VGELVRVPLPLPLPPILCEAAVYTGAGRDFAMYWTPFGDERVWSERTGTATIVQVIDPRRQLPEYGPMSKLVALILAVGIAAVLAVPALGSTPTKKVKVEDFKFSPKTLKIHRGTRVTWSWVAHSGIPHDVAVKTGPVKFHSGTRSSGSYSHLFAKKGTYMLVCTIHVALGMKMTIKVS